MSFHVYVEGALDPSPDGVARLAELVSSKFGMPVHDIAARLSSGRFRVKANVDRATADEAARILSQMGARAKIEDAGDGVGPARTGGSSLPPMNLPRTNTGSGMSSPALPRTTTGGGAKPAQMASGLSAAFSSTDAAPADLGALSNDSLSLASLDGNDDGSPPVSNSFEPPESAGLPASIGPAAMPAPAPPKAKSNPLDLFAPPDAEAESLVELAEPEAVKKPSSPVLRRSEPIPVLGGMAAPSRELSRAQFAAGVILAILIGFVPVHFIASSRESSAFTEIDNNIKRTQELAIDDEAYAALDGFRTAQLSAKQSKQRSIALTSMLMWAAISAGLAYVWFRRVPWEKFSKPA